MRVPPREVVLRTPVMATLYVAAERENIYSTQEEIGCIRSFYLVAESCTLAGLGARFFMCKPCTGFFLRGPFRNLRLTVSALFPSACHIVIAGWIADAFVSSTPGLLLRVPGRGVSRSPRSVDSGRGLFIFSAESSQRQEDIAITPRVSHHNLEGHDGRREVVMKDSDTTLGDARRHSNGLSRFATTVEECFAGWMTSFQLFSGTACSAAALSVIMIASTTEQDIMSAMSGLSIDEIGQGRPALVAPNGAKLSSDSSQFSGQTDIAGVKGGRGSSGGAAGFAERQQGSIRGQDLGAGQDNDLMQTLQERNVRQAGPLTHGF